MTKVRALYPIYLSDSGTGHTCMSICRTMCEPGFDVRLTVPSVEPPDRRDFVSEVVPPSLRALSCRKPLHGLRHWYTQRHFVNSLEPGDVVYLWPGVDLSTYEDVKARGNTLVMERINCHRATARAILDAVYDQLGWPAAHGITAEQTAREQRKLELADFVFCPSPLVRQSMLDAGVPAGKLLSSSYGWEPSRFRGHGRLFDPVDGPTFIFVGLGCVRKGTHLLLRCWERAEINGRLLLVGDLSPEIRANCADQLNRPDVVHVPYCDDVAAAYRSADVFVFPTYEEGSPLVSYEAMGCGLPILTSPMGAGEVIRDRRDGIVLHLGNPGAWVEAMRHLAGDRELRRSMAAGSRSRAQEFVWKQVGQHRRQLLQSKLLPGKSLPVSPSLAAS